MINKFIHIYDYLSQETFMVPNECELFTVLSKDFDELIVGTTIQVKEHIFIIIIYIYIHLYDQKQNVNIHADDVRLRTKRKYLWQRKDIYIYIMTQKVSIKPMNHTFIHLIYTYKCNHHHEYDIVSQTSFSSNMKRV